MSNEQNSDFSAWLKKLGLQLEEMGNVTNSEFSAWFKKLGLQPEEMGNVTNSEFSAWFKKLGLQLEEMGKEQNSYFNDWLKKLGLQLETMSMEQDPAEFYAWLKKTGFQLEGQMNQFIQDALNNEEIIKAANIGGQVLARLVAGLQDFIEDASIPMNFPTKNDVSRVGKLVVQSEDKLDLIEEEVFEILSMLKGKSVPEGISQSLQNRRKKVFKEKAASSSSSAKSVLIKSLLDSATGLVTKKTDDPANGLGTKSADDPANGLGTKSTDDFFTEFITKRLMEKWSAKA
ncbi:hypothetical protein [Metabacillus sp. RGM 3146]|uniref:hypothetical protein n=1 Tax=Metabacillus sp. RGM 3146 TaxID=3401092 RepID=UPI003B9B33D9